MSALIAGFRAMKSQAELTAGRAVSGSAGEDDQSAPAASATQGEIIYETSYLLTKFRELFSAYSQDRRPAYPERISVVSRE